SCSRLYPAHDRLRLMPKSAGAPISYTTPWDTIHVRGQVTTVLARSPQSHAGFGGDNEGPLKEPWPPAVTLLVKAGRFCCQRTKSWMPRKDSNLD
ncbi:hypothetical protein, partial [Porphyrobacter sp. TH134]|uniref:hypothetical protein n=1 Tax=Porphyrobacter sp. TH134 TaxID=2067450 RepID=UPI001F1F2188